MRVPSNRPMVSAFKAYLWFFRQTSTHVFSIVWLYPLFISARRVASVFCLSAQRHRMGKSQHVHTCSRYAISGLSLSIPVFDIYIPRPSGSLILHSIDLHVHPVQFDLHRKAGTSAQRCAGINSPSPPWASSLSSS